MKEKQLIKEINKNQSIDAIIYLAFLFGFIGGLIVATVFYSLG